MNDGMTDQSSSADERENWRRLLLDSVTSQSTVVFYVSGFGNDPRVRFVSPNIEAVTGDPVSAVLAASRYWRRQIHPDDLAKYAERTSRLAVGGTTTLNYRFKVTGGDYRWFRDEIRRQASMGGAGSEIVGCMVDVTAELDALSEFREIKSVHNTIVDNAPFAIVAMNEHGRIVEFNRAAEQMFGLKQSRVMGRSLSETLIPDQYRDQHERSVHRLRENRAALPPNRRLEVEARRADGTLFPVSIVVAQAVWGERSVFVSVITDLTEQVKAEEERQRLNQLLSDAVVSLSEGFALYDADDKLVMCNERYRDFHSGASEILRPGVNWLDLMRTEAERGHYVDAVGRVDEWLGELLRARGEFRPDVEFELADGRWVVGANRKTRQGGSVITLNEVTDRKIRERELQESRELLEDAIESLSEGFALWDADDRLVMCNQTYRGFNELCADILVPGVAWLDLIRTGAERGQYADAVGRMDEWIEKSIRDRRALRTNHEYEITDGRWCIGANRRTRHGGIVVTRIDITERKQMEKALQESEAFNRRVLDACPVAVEMTKAKSGEIIYESPASKALFGRTGSSGKVYACDVFVSRPDYDRYLRKLDDRGRLADMEVQLKKVDGSLFWASISARRIEYQGEVFIVSTTFDLTERRETEAELTRQREALHQSEKMTALGSLLAGVAHELNNPLTVVIGRAMILEETLQDTPHTAALEKLRAAAERCSKIVQSFLSMARQKEPSRERVRIDRVFEAALEIVSYGLQTDSIEVEVALDADLPEISADSSQLIQVFSNLLLNAQQALTESPQPRRIRVTGSYDQVDRNMTIDLTDNGPGIPPQNLPRIFDPFFTTKQTAQGTGLGLSVSQGLVKAHRGTLDVTVPDTGGTVFTIRLPVDTARATRRREDATAVQAPAGADILVVEDEIEIAAMLSEFLEPLGHRVVVAETGEVALNRLEEGRFDLVLTDLRMPDLDGRQLFEELQRRDPALANRTVFVTGDTLSGYFEAFLAQSGRPVIEKPFTPAQIRDIVSKELARAGVGKAS